jgi:predicted nucleic acid-binding protein
VDVFDSNIWVHGFTEQSGRPHELLAKLRDHQHEQVRVSPYIYEEVRAAFHRSAMGQEVLDLERRFVNFVRKCDFVEEPEHDAVGEMELENIRELATIRTLAQTLGCQAKDAPIVVVAYDLPGFSTIYTTDKSFAEIDLRRHFRNVAIRHVTPP